MASSDDFPGDASELNTTGSDAVTEEAADEEEEGNGKKEETRDISTSKNSCCGFIKVKLSLLEDEIRTQSKDLELIQKEVSEIKAISQEFPPSCVDLCNTELVSEKERFPKSELEFPDKNRQRHAVCDLLGQTHEELVKRNWLAKQLRKEISRFKKYTFEFKNKLQVTNSKAEEKQPNSNGLKTEHCQMCKFCMGHGDFQNSSALKYEESDGSLIEDLQEENEMLKDCLQKIHRKLRTFRFSESLGYKDTAEDPHYFPVNENTPIYIESVYNSFENFCEFYCKLQEELFKLRHALMTAEKNSLEHIPYSSYAPEGQAVYYGSTKENYQGNPRDFRERYDRFSDEKVYGNEKKFTRTMKQNFAAVPYGSKMESSGDLVYTDHRHKYLKKENRLQNELLYAQKQLEVLHSKIFEAVQLVRDVELEGNSNETLVEMVASIAEECNALRQEVSYLRKLRQEQRKSWNRLRHFIMDSEKRFEREGRNPANVGDIVRNLGNMIASSESSSLDEAILYMYNNQLEWLEHFYGIREGTSYDISQDNIDDGSIAPLEATDPRGCLICKKSVSTQTICQCIEQHRHWCKPLLENRMNDVSVQADEFFMGNEIPMDDEYDPASCMEVSRGIYVVHEEQEESENLEGNEVPTENIDEKPSESVSESEVAESEAVEQPVEKSTSVPTEAQSSLSLPNKSDDPSDNSDQPASDRSTAETQNQAEQQDENIGVETQNQAQEQVDISAETQNQEQPQEENIGAETQNQEQPQEENSASETQNQEQPQEENSAAETQNQEQPQEENSASETQNQEQPQEENSSAQTQNQEQPQEETQNQEQPQEENSAAETQNQAEHQDGNNGAETQNQAEHQDGNNGAETQNEAEHKAENDGVETKDPAKQQDENTSSFQTEQQNENNVTETENQTGEQDIAQSGSPRDEQLTDLPTVVVTDCSPGADPAKVSATDEPSENDLGETARVKNSKESASNVLSDSREHSGSLSIPNRSDDAFTEVSGHKDSGADENCSHHILPYPPSNNEVTLYPVRATEGFIPFSLTPDKVSVIQNYTVSNEGGEVITYENTTQNENMVNAVYSFLHKLNDSFSHGAKGNYWNLFLLGTLNNEAFSVSVERNDSPSSDGTDSASDTEENEEAGNGNDANSDSVPSELNRCSLKYVFYDAFTNNKIEFITNNTLPCVLYSTSPPGVNVLLPNTLPSNFNLLSQDLNYLKCMPKKFHVAKRSYAIEHSMSEHNGKVWLDPSSSTEFSDSIESWLNPVTHTVYYSNEEQLSNPKGLSNFEESLIIVSIVPKLLGSVNSNIESKYIVFERVQSLDQLRNNTNVCVTNFVNTRRGTFEIDAAEASELKTLNSIGNCGEDSKSDDAEKENSDENMPNRDSKTEEMSNKNCLNNEINVLKKYVVKISPSRSSGCINICSKCSSKSISDVPDTSIEIRNDVTCEVYSVPLSSNAITEDDELNDNLGAPVSAFRICAIPTHEEAVTESDRTEQPSTEEKEVSEETIDAQVAPDLTVAAKPVEEEKSQDTNHDVPNLSSVDSAVAVSEQLTSSDSTTLLDVPIQTEEDDYASLKKRIQELEMSLEEIDDVKKQHLQVTCDMAEQIEIYKQKENAYEQKLDIAERRRMKEVELAHQEHSLRENSLKDEMAALKENLDQQNAVLQRLKDDSEEMNKLLSEKHARINQQEEEITSLKEKLSVVEVKEASLDHSDSQTEELEELSSYEQLKEEVSKLKEEAQEMTKKLAQQKEAVIHVKSQLRATINHLQSLKDAALKQLQKQRKQLLQAIQERQQLYDAEVQIARQRREIQKKDDLLDSQNSQIGVMQENMVSMQEELKTKSDIVEEYEKKFQEKEKHDFWCQTMEDELESSQTGKTKSEKTLETLENQTVMLNELRHKFQNLESIRSVVEDLKHNMESVKFRKEVRPEVASSKEENQVQKLLSISEHTYLNLVGKLCEALKLKDLKGAKTLKLSTWLENEDLVEARRDDHRKILHTLERLKADAYNANEPSSHDWKRLMAESMYFTERKTSTPMCHSEDAHYQYLSEVLRRAQESLAREHYLKVPSQQRTVATAGSGRSDRRSSSRERRVPLELKNGKILAMLDDKVNHKELLPNKNEYHKMDSKNGSSTKKPRNT